MSKYSNEFKLKVVQYYLKGKTSYSETAKYFNMPDFSSIAKWVRKYKKHGIKGLVKPIKVSYSGEFKNNVIEYMHANHLSLKETAYHFNIGCHDTVGKWERIYYEKGPHALYRKSSGMEKEMKSKRTKSKELGEDKEKEALLKEIEQLRMENAYLKKLQALIQERTKPKHPKK